jgi:hypothetical protein
MEIGYHLQIVKKHELKRKLPTSPAHAVSECAEELSIGELLCFDGAGWSLHEFPGFDQKGGC